MTDDLVKRLRERIDFRVMTASLPPQNVKDWLCQEAASRIETLEEALRKIEMLHYDSEKDFYHDAMKAHHIAVAALGEKKDG